MVGKKYLGIAGIVGQVFLSSCSTNNFSDEEAEMNPNYFVDPVELSMPTDIFQPFYFESLKNDY